MLSQRREQKLDENFELLRNTVTRILILLLTSTCFFPSGPFFSPNDPDFFMELAKDNFTTPITGLDRVVAYWTSEISISVSISEQMLDIIFEAPLSFKGNKTKGLLGTCFEKVTQRQYFTIELLDKAILIIELLKKARFDHRAFQKAILIIELLERNSIY